MEIKLKDLLEAGCHFGHQVTRWNPKMKSYIFTSRDKVHIFDLVKTKEGLEAASAFVKETVANSGKIIFVGTKRQAKDIIKETAERLGMPYVSNRWIGGTLTNWDQIKRNIDKLKDLKSKRDAGELKEFTKMERLLIDREIFKLEQTFGGLVSLETIPEAIFLVDVKKEMGAAKEAKIKGIKSIGIVDTNSDPNLVDFVIPANDDAVKSVQFIVNYIAEAVEAGLKRVKSEKLQVKSAFGKTEEESKEVKESKVKTESDSVKSQKSKVKTKANT